MPAVERAIARDDRRMIGFHDDIDVHAVPLDVVRGFGDPAELFMNVNTREDLDRAQRIAAGERV